MLFTILVSIGLLIVLLVALNFVSYRIMGGIIRNRRKKWDLNICCGKTDGGGVNVDIVKHAEIENLVVVDDIYSLPFQTNQFEHTLCSHTIEHVEDPVAFFKELERISENVTLVVPPLWDLSAALNIFEHRSLFLTFRKEHHKLPPHTKLPLAAFFQEKLGQRIRA
ncbi:methyltransferase domain-containing protein [Verrucomicrobiales bacterium BCK34]|nr:methyltransferase domain-containing protein [Verrucomicrobiales bacterium BCK34]